MLCFLVTSFLRFALLPHYRRIWQWWSCIPRKSYLKVLSVVLHHNLIPELQSPSETNKLQFLCCQNGVQLASNVVAQIAFTRIHLCRDLFILLKLMINLSAKVGHLHFLCYSRCPWYFRPCKNTKNKQSIKFLYIQLSLNLILSNFFHYFGFHSYILHFFVIELATDFYLIFDGNYQVLVALKLLHLIYLTLIVKFSISFTPLLKIRQYFHLHMKIKCWKFHTKTRFTLWDMRTWYTRKVCLQTFTNNRICHKLGYFWRNLQISWPNNSRILRIKNAKFLEYCCYMKTHIGGFSNLH